MPISLNRHLHILTAVSILGILFLLSGCGPVMMANKITKPDTQMKCGGMMKKMKCESPKNDKAKNDKNENEMKCSSGKCNGK